MAIFWPSWQVMVKGAVSPWLRGWAARMRQFWPKKGYLALGKPW